MKKHYKKIIALVFIILFITLTPVMSYINIENNVYASITLTGIGIKLVATILASMGVLKYVNENIGMDEFYQGLLEFVENVKQVADLPEQLFQIASTAITTSTKIKVQEIYKMIKEYFNNVVEDIIPDELLAPIYEDVISVGYYNQTKTLTTMLGWNGYKTIMTEIIGNGYELVVEGMYNNQQSNVSIRSKIKIKAGGYENIVSGTEALIEIPRVFGAYNLSKLIIQAQATTNKCYLNVHLSDMVRNEMFADSKIIDYAELVGLAEIPIIDYENIPIVKSVPINMTFPWDLTLDTEDVLGLNIEQLLEVINNLQLEEYLDRLLDLPKSIVDSMNPPFIEVEDGVITGVTETTWDDALPDIKEQTDILTQIRDRIDIMIDSIDKFFNPENNPPGSEDDNGTDWGNFKNFFDIFWIFYYLIILAIIILLKFFSVIMTILSIPANTALFDQYPTMLSGLNYIKNIKVGGFNVTLQVIFEYMFTVFFFLYIVTTLQKLYHSFMGIERIQSRENEREARYEKYDNERHYEPNNFTKGIMHANEQKPNNGLSFKDDDYENIKFTGWGD